MSYNDATDGRNSQIHDAYEPTIKSIKFSRLSRFFNRRIKREELPGLDTIPKITTASVIQLNDND